jgi:hypothetical protein
MKAVSEAFLLQTRAARAGFLCVQQALPGYRLDKTEEGRNQALVSTIAGLRPQTGKFVMP